MTNQSSQTKATQPAQVMIKIVSAEFIMTNHKPTITNPAMGQAAPFTQHQQANNRHPANRHRYTPKKPRYAHKVQQQGKDTSTAQNPQKTAQNGANTMANKPVFGMSSTQHQPSCQHPTKTTPKSGFITPAKSARFLSYLWADTQRRWRLAFGGLPFS